MKEINSSTSQSNDNFLIRELHTTNGQIVLLMLFFIGLLQIAKTVGGSNKKALLGRGRLGGKKEIKNALTIALQQLKHPKIDKNSLWVGETKDNLPTKNALALPFMNQGGLIVGSSGMGKTVHFHNPMIRSAIKRGFSIILYDFKYPEQSMEILPFAKAAGYKVYIFAPGYPETQRINPIGFLKDSSDENTADSIARDLIGNLKTGDSKNNDEFFTEAGIAVVRALFMLSKWVAEVTERPELGDLMTADAILNLPNLAQKLIDNKDEIRDRSPWVYKAFSQLIVAHGDSKEVNKTESSILASAQRLFQMLVRRDFIPAFCGESTIPTRIDDKTIVVFGMDQNRRTVVAPIMAGIMSELVSQNISHGNRRKVPVLLSVDEAPSIRLERSLNWVAEARSSGFMGLFTCQNRSQMDRLYGEQGTETLFGNLSTKIFFNPQENKTAEYLSRIVGEKDVWYRTKSISYSKGNRNTTRAEQVQKVPVLEVNEILNFPEGQAVIISPGFGNKKNSYLPIKRKFTLTETIKQQSAWAKEEWTKNIAPDLLKNGLGIKNDADEAKITDTLTRRIKLVEYLFPLAV